MCGGTGHTASARATGAAMRVFAARAAMVVRASAGERRAGRVGRPVDRRRVVQRSRACDGAHEVPR